MSKGRIANNEAHEKASAAIGRARSHQPVERTVVDWDEALTRARSMLDELCE